MGRIEVDWEWFLGPLEWSIRRSQGRGFWTRIGALTFGLSYFVLLTVCLVVVFPILWIWEQVK